MDFSRTRITNSHISHILTVIPLLEVRWNKRRPESFCSRYKLMPGQVCSDYSCPRNIFARTLVSKNPHKFETVQPIILSLGQSPKSRASLIPSNLRQWNPRGFILMVTVEDILYASMQDLRLLTNSYLDSDDSM